jgi:hypothetical protein
VFSEINKTSKLNPTHALDTTPRPSTRAVCDHCRAKKKAVKKKMAGRKAMTKKTTATSSRPTKALTTDDLVEAKKLVDELGGIDQAREALKYLGLIHSSLSGAVCT